jgi:polysaccharide biosynthesis protein PslG
MRKRDRRMRLTAALLGTAALGIAVAVAFALRSTGGSARRNAPATSGSHSTATGTGSSSPASASAGPVAQPAPATESFGVNLNDLFNGAGYSPRQIDAQLAAVRATGATVARSDALWEASEPAAPRAGVHSYSWGFDDSIAGSLAADGLRWFPIIDYTAPWAQSIPGQDHSPPRSASDYAAYAAAFAARYGSGGSFWRAHPELRAEPVDTYEIWNEPDNQQFWVPAPDAAAYANLYLRARDTITAVDPTARVIVGGITHPEAFLPEMLRARPDLVGHIDGVAIHPYGPNPFVVLARVRGARSVLASLGLATVPIYVSEFGWTTRPPGVFGWASERVRPGYISSTVTALGETNCGIAAVQLYTWVTPQLDPTNKEDWYGIHPPRGGSSRDTDALAASLQAVSHTPGRVRLCGAG